VSNPKPGLDLMYMKCAGACHGHATLRTYRADPFL